MKFKLSRKNAQKKWWSYGRFEKNQWGNYQASFKVDSLLEAIELAKQEPNYKGYINFSGFEDDGSYVKKDSNTPPQGSAVTHQELDDEIPF